MYKKLLSILISFSICLLLAGCRELVKSETVIENVTIVDANHSSFWMQPVRVGKVTTFIHHPEKNIIVVSYDGVEYSINDREAYDKYKDYIGKVIEAEFLIDYYDDGVIKYYLQGLK